MLLLNLWLAAVAVAAAADDVRSPKYLAQLMLGFLCSLCERERAERGRGIPSLACGSHKCQLWSCCALFSRLLCISSASPWMAGKVGGRGAEQGTGTGTRLNKDSSLSLLSSAFFPLTLALTLTLCQLHNNGFPFLFPFSFLHFFSFSPFLLFHCCCCLHKSFNKQCSAYIRWASSHRDRSIGIFKLISISITYLACTWPIVFWFPQGENHSLKKWLYFFPSLPTVTVARHGCLCLCSCYSCCAAAASWKDSINLRNYEKWKLITRSH